MGAVSPFYRVLRPFITTPSEPKADANRRGCPTGSYQTWPAADKQSYHVNEARKSAYARGHLPSESFPNPLKMATALATHVLTFDHAHDFMPALPLIGERERAIHTHGVIAGFKYESTGGHGFTGILASGALGVIRTSNALPKANIPGIGALFFVSGGESVGFVGIHELAPQANGVGFFEKSVRNVLPEPKGAPAKIGGAYFDLARKYSHRLTASNLASVDRNGNAVENSNVPDEVSFEATETAKALLGTQSGTDIRQDFIDKLPGGTPLYDVYATKDGRKVKIGTITTTSNFIASVHGDKKFFVRHNRGGIMGFFLESAKEMAKGFGDDLAYAWQIFWYSA